MSDDIRSGGLAAASAAARVGDFAGAGRQLRAWINEHPLDVDALTMLASICGQSGELDEAITLCRRVLKIHPESIPALANLASALRGSGRAAAAVGVAETLVAASPANPNSYLNLGLARLAAADPAGATTALTRTVQLDRRLVIAHLALGTAFRQLDRLEEAARTFRYILSLEPQHFRALHALAQLCIEMGHEMEADQLIDRLRLLQPVDPRVRLDLARALNELGAPKDAEEILTRLVRDHPAYNEAARLLALRYQETGRFTEARNLLLATLAANAADGAAYWGLAQIRRLSEADLSFIADAEAALRLPDAKAEDKMFIHYALGKALDDLGRYEAAIGHFDVANRLAEARIPEEGRFSRETTRQEFDDVIDRWSAESFEGCRPVSDPSAKPIFIVGMMRSGTTLVEQIVSRHTQVGAGGELEFWLARGHLAADRGVGQIPRDIALRLTRGYKSILDRAAPGSVHVTDKKPQNFLLLGQIHALFPNAKIVHCRRNPVDTCLSIYMNAFRESPTYAHRRETLAAYYREYERLMTHWKNVLPAGTITEVVYEELVENRDEVTRRLIDFLDLAWDDACLSPENNDRTVATLSLWQVRQPVYSSSINRWRQYEPWLGALRELLPETSS